MADYNSSLPIRTENAGDAIVKVADATIPSQQLKVESDGSINVNAAFSPGTEVIITDGTDDLAINGDGSLNAVVTATDLDIRNLAPLSDQVSIGDGTDVLAINVDGSINVTDNGGSLTVDAADLDIRDLVFSTDKVDVSNSVVALDSSTLSALESITVQNPGGASAVNIQDGGNSITVDGSVTVSATDLDIRDLSAAQDNVAISDGSDTLAINADGSINVRISEANGASSVADYDTQATLAAAASDTHTYTSTGNFYLEQVEASASGKLKIEVQVNGSTRFVQFNSTANPNCSLQLKQPILVTSGQTVTVIRTNRDNQAQDVYSTILGFNA